MKLMSI